MVHWAPNWRYIELNVNREKGRVGKWKVQLLKYVSHSCWKSNSERSRSECQPGIIDQETDFSLEIKMIVSSFTVNLASVFF